MRKKIGSGITDSNGVASCNYTGKAVGKMNVVAETKTDDRILQSEIYDVLDCIYYDDMSSDTSSNYYVNTANNSIGYNNGYVTITANTSTSGNLYVDLRSLTNDLIGKTVNVEVDVVLNGVSARLRILKNGSSLMNSEYTTSDGTITLQNVDLTETADSYFIRLETRNTAIGDSIQFKNLKVYPI